MKTILIIEDDISILEGLKDNLEFEGYKVITETDGNRRIKTCSWRKISDFYCSISCFLGMNGYEICRKMKSENPEIPIIMLTARGSEMDKVSGLDIGADDYITKPFSLPELMASIRAALQKNNKDEPATPEYYSFGNIRLDFNKYTGICRHVMKFPYLLKNLPSWNTSSGMKEKPFTVMIC